MTTAMIQLILLVYLLPCLQSIQAAPLGTGLGLFTSQEPVPRAADPDLWIYLGTAVALVLLGGAFAGLTIALMGQDEIHLQVIASSGEGAEKKHAQKVLNLLRKGKHWVLVTLLMSNVITNETLPIVLDRSIGGGWPAVLSSTVLVVIFGEIAPQSVCVRYGLPIGAWMAPFVIILMWLLSPVAWPTAKLLDWLLGEDHGTTYKKAGLKTLVSLHKTLGSARDERLTEDEVTILTAVLDLKEKSVGRIMTPIEDTFCLPANAILDEEMIQQISKAGYSRIPVYSPDNERDYLGMLLVKMLISYDPEDCSKVQDFALATLPETRSETSCLDIVNFFQEGKSHMVLVSENPGESHGALGVVTLEDVIEELIGEEIIDESDVFVDVHKAVRRMHPAPRMRIPKSVLRPTEGLAVESDNEDYRRLSRNPSISEVGRSPAKATTFLMRRRSSTNGSVDVTPVPIRSGTPEARKHLQHVGPSNLASQPKPTRIGTVKIKPPGVSTIPEGQSAGFSKGTPGQFPPTSEEVDSVCRGRTTEPIVHSAGKEASDGVQFLQQNYGTMSTSDQTGQLNGTSQLEASPKTKGQTTLPPPAEGVEDDLDVTPKATQRGSQSTPGLRRRPSGGSSAKSPMFGGSSRTSPSPNSALRRAGGVRSGSISENFVDTGRVRKMVLEANSSSETDAEMTAEPTSRSDEGNMVVEETPATSPSKKKKRKKRANKKKRDGGGGEEGAPLLS